VRFKQCVLGTLGGLHTKMHKSDISSLHNRIRSETDTHLPVPVQQLSLAVASAVVVIPSIQTSCHWHCQHSSFEAVETTTLQVWPPTTHITHVDKNFVKYINGSVSECEIEIRSTQIEMHVARHINKLYNARMCAVQDSPRRAMPALAAS
jgi:hypothetical protein